MPKIIIVQGVSKSFKTTGIVDAMNKLGIHVGKGGRDVLVSARIQVDGHECIVGFASGGDSEAIIRENIEFFRRINIAQSHIVFACRSRGVGIEILRAYAVELDAEVVVINSPRDDLDDEIIQNIP